MQCNDCEKEKTDFVFFVIPKDGKRLLRFCRDCRRPKGGIPDVYFKGAYVDEHIASEEFPGPKEIRSRQEKAYWLKKCNLRESGDRYHGASRFDPISHKHAMKSIGRS